MVRPDSTEGDRTLGGLFDKHRADLDHILGVDLSREVERLFHLRPGPAIRHELAHGQISSQECYSPNILYAIWLLYRIVVLFVLEDWDEIIKPSIEAA